MADSATLDQTDERIEDVIDVTDNATDDVLTEDVLVEEVSIDGMCGVY